MKIAIHNKIVFQDATLRYDSERHPRYAPLIFPNATTRFELDTVRPDVRPCQKKYFPLVAI